MEDIYGALTEKDKPTVELKERHDAKRAYFEFLRDFRDYIAEFVRESSVDLVVSSIDVDTTPKRIFNDEMVGSSLVLKNQGLVPCLLSTDRQGFYRLDPGEKQQFWLNQDAIVVTISGATTLGFIRT